MPTPAATPSERFMAAVAQSHARAPQIGGVAVFWIALAVIAVLKFVLLLIYGPIVTPDTGGYVAYAQAMRASSAWLSDAGLSQAPIPLLTMRMIGYPAVVVA